MLFVRGALVPKAVHGHRRGTELPLLQAQLHLSEGTRRQLAGIYLCLFLPFNS